MSKKEVGRGARTRSEEEGSTPEPLSGDRALEELRARGADRLVKVSFRANRRTIWSVTGGGTVLNLHEGYRRADPELLDHLALVARHPRGGPPEARKARQVVRHHPPLIEALEAIHDTRRPPRTGPNCATPAQQAYLDALYGALNRATFAGALPAGLPIRLSRRMRSTWGKVTLGRRRRSRVVTELALNLDLMLEANDALRLEVMLHEMAHVEAWILHGDRGHGRHWKGIARRVGCTPRARSRRPVATRKDPDHGVERVPPFPPGLSLGDEAPVQGELFR